METTLINHPRLKVRVETGSEGPRYDPYAFKETTIKANGKKVVLHEGLGDWLKIDGQEVEPPKFIGKFSITYREQAASAWRRAAVEDVAGYSLEQIERIARKLSSRCKKCGGKEFHTLPGSSAVRPITSWQLWMPP